MAGIILAGGRSRRMGFDKAGVMLGARSMLDMIITSLSLLFPDIIICGRRYFNADFPWVRCADDIYKGVGPIGGIYTGLFHSSDDFNFVTACDIPGIERNTIGYMQTMLGNSDACIISSGDYVEPLFGFYRKRTLPLFKEYIERGSYKISDLYGAMNMKYVQIEEMRCNIPGFWGIDNINTPEDVERYKKRAGD
jgi:molybdopterin-guanine dinucleotide biosynthesis protein A